MSALLWALALVAVPPKARPHTGPEELLVAAYPSWDRESRASDDDDPALRGAKQGREPLGALRFRHFKQYLSALLVRRFPVVDGHEASPAKPEGCELLLFERPWREVPKVRARLALPACASLSDETWPFDRTRALLAVRAPGQAGQAEHRLLLVRYDGDLELVLDAALDGARPPEIRVEPRESGASVIRVTVHHVDGDRERRFLWDGKNYVEPR